MKIYLTLFFFLLTHTIVTKKARKLQVVTNAQKPKKRKLILNWFDSSEESKKTKSHQDNVKKLMDLLKLAHSFKGDPNFDVNVEINYKNDNESLHDHDVHHQQHNERKLNLLKKAAKKYGQRLKLKL